MPTTKVGVWKLLLGSRKFVVMVLTALCGAGSTVLLRFGFQVDAVTLAGVVTPIVLAGIALITGISTEDAASKSAGAGTTKITTTQPLPEKAGGGLQEVTTVEPDPAGKP